MKKSVIIIFFLCLVLSGVCNLPDSLENVVKHSAGKERVWAMLKLAEFYTQNNTSRAQEYFAKCFTEVNVLDDYVLKARIHGAYGLYLIQAGEMEKSYDYIRKADSLAELSKDLSVIGSMKNALGNYFNATGGYKKAIEYYLMSAKTLEKTQNPEKLHEPYCNIGVVYSNNQAYAEARSYFFYGLQLIKKLAKPDVEAEGKLYHNIGLTYLYDEKSDSALLYIRKSLNFSESNKLYNEYANTCINLSTYYIDHDEFDRAISWIKRALSTYNKNGFLQGIAHAYYALNTAYYKNNETDKAIRCLDSSRYYFNMIGDLNGLLGVYDYFAMAYEKKGNLKMAMFYLKKFHGLNDSLYDIESQNSILLLEKQFNFEKKQKEIEILNKENQLKSVTIKSDRTTKKYYLIFLILAVLIVVYVVITLFGKIRTNKLLKTKNEEIERQKSEVEIQKEVISEKQKEILDSIHYAKRIQKALLPNSKVIERHLNRLRKI